ncbi:DUF1735 domain-containing protein [Thalassobellus suaedae]|uniref:DUF1735 domain-containing protein n=1 Tax=Thalassobellus suaedae TaxID=3074124 RepID=A0ABY9Y1B9_9FLAO|nr:DUF1735 domain-containing protein [Flavobacteriaceae bacterium HL-DH10]
MKKILIFLVLLSVLTSCYDEFRLDNEFSSVAFSSADGGSNETGVLWRTVVKGEGLKLDAGIYLAGILDNKNERWAEYQLDPSLLSGTDYTMLPANYYSLSNSSRFIIPAGETVGKVSIVLDSIQFLNDPLTTKMNYAIPFKLIETSEDSILSTQKTQILVLKYINKQEGFYNQNGDFETVAPGGETLNSGNISNVLKGSTIYLDSLEMNGLMNLIGDNYKMKLHVNADNSVSLEYSPNLEVDNSPKNIALDATVTSSYVAPWNSENAVKSGTDPASSAFTDQILAWGNYGAPSGPAAENWIEYDFGSTFSITMSEVYWAADGGGVVFPNKSYLEYWDLDLGEWKILYNNNVVNGVAVSEADYGVIDTGNDPDKYNVTSFDKIDTNKIRIYATPPAEFIGIHEWRVWGIPAPVGYESSPIASIVENGTNTYDPATGTFNLNYTVNYAFEEYTTNVSTEMVWRNRIRDGVNEWRP